MAPTSQPITNSPTPSPTNEPPSSQPSTNSPTETPDDDPTESPTNDPTRRTDSPTESQNSDPTPSPTNEPTRRTKRPTKKTKRKKGKKKRKKKKKGKKSKRKKTTKPTRSPTNAPTSSNKLLLHSTLDSAEAIESPEVGIEGYTTLKSSQFVDGMLGRGAVLPKLDGSGDYIKFPAALKSKHIDFKKGSLSFYYKPNYSSSTNDIQHALIVVGSLYNSPPFVLMEGDALRLTLQEPNFGKAFETAGPWRGSHWIENQWVFIKIVWDAKSNDSLKIFVDDTRIDSGSTIGGWSLGSETNLDMWVGTANSNGDFGADGIIDDLKISE